MTDKTAKMKARLPRGFVDRVPEDLRAAEKMLATIRSVYELYGFEPIETPLVEYTDALGKFLPDQDRPNEGVFSLQDDDEQWLSLRYDLTAPLARHVAENFNEIQLPFRTYRNGWVFRNEKPGPGRFRQFMQFDADTVGAPGVAADAEMCMMAADTLERLGIARGDYVIRVNNRKVLDGVLESIGLAGDENANRRLNVLRAVDKLDKFGEEGVKLLLGEGRRDESGDFTKGAGLDAAAIAKVLEFTAAGSEDGQQTIANLRKVVEGNARGVEGVEELAQMQALFDAGNYQGRVKIDPSVVRGLEYYTGPVYEAELQFDVTNEKGEKVVFGSVGGGGRYDGLVSRFRGQPVPATGFSIGVSRLMTALKNLGKIGQEETIAPVLVTVMDGDAESLGHYQKFTQSLRDAGIRAEMYQGNWKKFGNQLKYADRRNSPLAIIQGGDERAQGEVQIKDLIEGKRLSGEIESNEEWRASRPAQVTVKEQDLVTEVQKILAAQADDRAKGLS
ncbi:histidyl-tRNA synthetase [Paenochrobactrum gallinarii]|uniref:Histidine--tRNA ligase n=1 Tax=Paenochrobactrum gallinarii TaxID=643673 RepID=A0A841M2R0_9HYPH|nr:histidine--tRNA ligase [Paenochrobactrum gallinarii]MBB6260438.1 histidyl-tRNA synthetase [Paenochrobactrum gallinarii]